MEMYETCNLYIKATALPNSKTFMKVTKTAFGKNDERVQPKSDSNTCIESSNQKLCIVSDQNVRSETLFEYTRPDGEKSNLKFVM